MFESDNWDLDQDVLNDVDDKAVKYFFQNDNQAFQSKKRKMENNDNPIFSSVCNHTVNKTAIKHNENKESRKNLIIELFKKNSSGKSVSNSTTKSYDISLNNSTNDTQYCQKKQLLRNNLVLGILKKKNIQADVIENNTKNTEVQKVKLDIKSNNNGNMDVRKECIVLSNNIKNKTLKSNCETEGSSKQHSSKNPRRQLLCDIIKHKSIDIIKSKDNNSKSKFPTIKSQVQPNEKITLVRKFPGPAGLLPDDIDFNIPCVSYLYSLEESEKTKEDPNSKNLPEYCSQNTKSLFSEGAWQKMLDDLPSGFLKGCDIASVKQTATLNGFNSTKIEFLAGIVEHIDFSHDNPPIVLKDFTGSIQGIVHRDIPLKHPGVLEANVVVLLHDVGLLRTSGAFVSNKYQILISPSSLLAIYTSKGLIEFTEHLEPNFRYISEGKIREMEKKKVGYNYTQLLKADSPSNSYQLNATNKNNSKELRNSTNIKKEGNRKETDEVINESFDFDTDVYFSVLSTKVPNSPSQLNYINLMPKDRKHLKQENEKSSSEQFIIEEEKSTKNHEETENLLKSLKSFAPGAKRHLCRNATKDLQMGAGHSGSTIIHFKEDKSKLSKNVSIENMNFDKCDTITSVEEIKSITVSSNPTYFNRIETKHGNNITSIRSQLQQFKSVDISNPLKDFANKKNEMLPEEKSLKALNSIENMLCITENDSDDEMLSQLDTGTIFNNYNNTS